MVSADLLARIFHINPEPMTLSRLDNGQYVEVNESFLKTFGYSRQEVIGHTAKELGIWESLERDRDQIVQQIRAHGFVSDFEATFLTKTGETIKFYLGATRIEGDERPLLLIVGRNITAIRNSEAALRLSEARFRGLIENLPLGVFIAQDGLIRYANAASIEMIEYRPEEILGQPFLQLVHEEDREMVAEFHRRRMQQGDDSDFCYDLRVTRKGGGVYYWRIHASANVWEGRVASLAVCSDITQQKLAERRMSDLALYDQITGLPNRMQLEDYAHQAVTLTSGGFAVIYLDLDRFKPVNDRFGHEIGDQVLKEVATRLRRSIRETDMAARIGGDEFAVLLQNVGSYGTAMRAAENIRLLLNRPILSTVSKHQIGASIGISLYPADGSSLDILLSRADEAMYRAKRAGRNCVCCYADDGAQRDDPQD
jgi:diguanylate cyclase (GGDEF)-like protein/PAS domain S-box-containing protein